LRSLETEGTDTMMLVVDPRSPTPPYEQVRAQVADLVHRGELAPGTRLPTVRRLADDLGLAPNTVARAYRELEQAGVVETRGRHGTYVAARDETSARAAEAAAEYAARVRELGVPPEEGLRLARAALGLPEEPRS
jgi:DNA-binding transcriptional regulator YhcF (GntR family)